MRQITYIDAMHYEKGKIASRKNIEYMMAAAETRKAKEVYSLAKLESFNSRHSSMTV